MHTPSQIHIPNAPAIPGLTFRRFRGEADYPLMVALMETCRIADGLDAPITEETLRIAYEHLDNCDPYRDMLFAEVERQVIAYSRVWWRDESAGRRIYRMRGYVHPEYRRKGLGAALLAYTEARARAIAASHPAEKPKFFRVNAAESQRGANALYRRFGYQPCRYFYEMKRPFEMPISKAPMPAGLEIHPVETEQVRAVFAAYDEAFRDHWAHTPLTENEIQAWMQRPTFNPALWKVAWEGNQIAGMVLNFVDEHENQVMQRRRGYTEDICVRRPWRRRGLARALLVESLRMFRRMGMTETALGVDAHNPNRALRLYECVGYQTERKYNLYEKPLR